MPTYAARLVTLPAAHNPGTAVSLEASTSMCSTLKAHPDATVLLPDEHPRAVRARQVDGAERDRLWP